MAANLFQTVYFKTLRVVAGIGTTVILGVTTLPHLFPEKTISALNALPNNGNVVSNKKYEQLLKETCALMDLDSSKVKLFHTSGFGTVSAGSVYLPNAALVGLPRNASFRSTSDIVNSSITFGEKPIDWKSNAGDALQEALLLSNNEIKFLLGHELTHIKNLDFIPTALHSVGFFYGTYKASVVIPTKLKSNRLLQTLLLNWMVIVAGCWVYFQTRTFIAYQSEYKADENSAKLGKDYCEGGISYMKKRLKLNRVLRSLHGPKGENLFTKAGNEVRELSSHPKRSHRLKQLRRIDGELYGPDSSAAATQ